MPFDLTPPWPDLVMVYTAYVISAGTPGPSNMAIMGVAMNARRPHAVAMAAGVVTGSIFWACLAGTGLSVVLTSYAEVLIVIKVLGGCYLLYLALRAARSTLRATAAFGSPAGETGGSLRRRFAQGLLFHLTNPKAVLGWVAVMTLGLKDAGATGTLPLIIGGCAVLGVTIFGSYAVLFSSRPMARLYARARRWLEAALALFFGIAGIRLLASR